MDELDQAIYFIFHICDGVRFVSKTSVLVALDKGFDCLELLLEVFDVLFDLCCFVTKAMTTSQVLDLDSERNDALLLFGDLVVFFEGFP